MKISLAPALVAGATLLGRKWGDKVSGWLVGFPIVGGPILLLLDLEQGHLFAARAAEGALRGLLALCVYLVVYARAALRMSWPGALACGWLAFALVTVFLKNFYAPWQIGLPLACLAIVLSLRCLPEFSASPRLAVPAWDLPLRMLATAVLVLGLTGLSNQLGPDLSGLLTPFPVASTVLVVFAHRHSGPAGVVGIFRGFLPGLFGFAVFCGVLSAKLPQEGRAITFGAGLALVAIIQLLVLKIIHRS